MNNKIRSEINPLIRCYYIIFCIGPLTKYMLLKSKDDDNENMRWKNMPKVFVNYLKDF